MMIEDKLTPEQRIKLESIGQANTFLLRSKCNSELLIATAKQIAAYIRGEGEGR